MKKTVLTSIAIVAILMAGCSKKRPEVAVQEAPVMSDARISNSKSSSKCIFWFW